MKDGVMERMKAGQRVVSLRHAHLDPEHFNLEVVYVLWSRGRSEVARFPRHADMNCDLEVILLLANKGLISWRVVKAFICVHVIGWKGTTDR